MFSFKEIGSLRRRSLQARQDSTYSLISSSTKAEVIDTVLSSREARSTGGTSSSSVLENRIRSPSCPCVRSHNVENISADCLLSLSASTIMYTFGNFLSASRSILLTSPRLSGSQLLLDFVDVLLYLASTPVHNVASMLHNWINSEPMRLTGSCEAAFVNEQKKYVTTLAPSSLRNSVLLMAAELW